MMQRYGRDADSVRYWSDEAGVYAAALENDYHTHRLSMIERLTPSDLYAPGRRIYDFGCGDAVLFHRFLHAGAHIEGHDIAPEMIALAHDKLRDQGHEPSLAQVGGVSAMAALPDEGFDAVLSYNVLAYLTDEEEAQFYAHARRILKPGGYLLVTHSNELFDLFTLNRYTAEFIAAHLAECGSGRVGELLTNPDAPSSRTTFNVRENPLAYRHKLADFGFREVRQEFSNRHRVPPLLQEGSKDFPNTDLPERERWKLMFTCSTFGSCSVRDNGAQGAGV